MKIATRAAYGQALAALGEKYPDLVVLDADLSGSTMTKDFAAKYPDRFFDMGIAEGNMAGVAAGLAACGKKPFINSFAMFSAGRAWEQVRNSIAYPGLNVKVIGSHGGLPGLAFLDFAVAEDGVDPVVFFVQLSGQSHAYGGRDTLSQGAGGHIDALHMHHVRVAGVVVLDGTELVQILLREIAPQRQHGIQGRGAVSFGQHEPIPIRIVGCAWIDAHSVKVQRSQ